MNKKVVTFGDSEVEKLKFCNQKNPILMDDMDMDKKLLSNRFSCKDRL